MTSLIKLLLRELISSVILGVFLYLYNQEPDYIRCMCYVPISAVAISRFLLQMMGKLRTDIYCGLTESWMLSFMNIPCFILVFYLFMADFIIGFRESVSQPLLVALKCYISLNYLMYIRYYFGYFNLELQFSFFPLILEAIMSGYIWNEFSDQSLQNKTYLITLGAFIIQVIIYVIIFPKQTKEIVPLIDMPFNLEEQTRNRSQSQTPQSEKKQSKKNKNKKRD